MHRVAQLNHTAQLKQVGFGRPSPRHGLHLLHWFSTECLYFNVNNKLVPRCNPDERDFGFHLFENRVDQNGVRLLPDINAPYYVVGNLNSDGADELPAYVTQGYTGLDDDSNKDRIIVSLRNGWFDKVYITEHRDLWNYDPNKTYRINNKLINYIARQERENFLNDMGFGSMESVAINIGAELEPPRSRGFWDYCIIL